MKALVINCCPVRTGATAEIAKLVSEQLSAKYSVTLLCCKPYRPIHAPMEASKAENGKHIMEKLKNIGKEGI